MDLFIPESVTNIDDYAFESCTGLTNVILQRQIIKDIQGSITQYLTRLGYNSFYNTTGINSTNYNCLTIMYIDGYTEAELRSGNYDNGHSNPDSYFTDGMSSHYIDKALFMYSGAGFDNEAVTNAIAASCFNEDTKILCLNIDTNEEEYVAVQNLKTGDLIKTYLHGYRKVDVLCKGKIKNNTKYFTTCMYKMSKTETNELTEDLIVIGGHALLVDKLSEEEYAISASLWGSPLEIDGKYLLLAGITDKFERIEGDEVFTYYHFCVENDGDDEARYGVWANGVLVETPCKKDILAFRNVKFL